jgi:hypothetical protein
MSANNNNSAKSPETDSKTQSTEDYGYYYYPERQGVKQEGLWNKLTEGRSSARTLKCIRNVHECARKGDGRRHFVNYCAEFIMIFITAIA